MKMLGYTRKKGIESWKRAKDLDNLAIGEWLAAKLSARIHNAEVRWKYS